MNRLLTVLIVQVMGISAQRTHAELLAVIEPTGLSRRDIAAALGTTEASLAVALMRERQAASDGNSHEA
jgi:hypothetical protein